MTEAQAETAGAPNRAAYLPGWKQLTAAWQHLARHRVLVAILVAGLLLRLILATFPRFQFDTDLFASFSDRLASVPPWDFYDTEPRPFYTPGYLYFLWPLGELRQIFGFDDSQFQYVLKLLPIAADLISAALLFVMLRESKPLIRHGAVALYLVFPTVLFVGAVWGQTDSVLALLLLTTVYFISRGHPMAGALTFTFAFMVKPIAIAALPFLAVWIMRRHPPEVWARITAASLAFALLLILPFYSYRIWEFIDHLQWMTTADRANSGFTFNFWQIFGSWQMASRADSVREFGLPTQYWGIILYCAATVLTIAALWRRDGAGALVLGTGICVLAFFLFVTRMHERYGFSFLLLCLTAAALYRSWLLVGVFTWVGIINLVNYYWGYSFYQNDSWLVVDKLYAWVVHSDALGLSSLLGFRVSTQQVMSFLIVAALPVLLLAAYFTRDPEPPGQEAGTQ
jgi:Gpi18-like mannosyltransferase